MEEGEKFYLTKEGLEKIKKEYEDLKRLRAMKVAGESPQILESEEVSSEYLSLQEDLDLLEARLAELENVLKNVEIIKPPPKEQRDTVNLGAKVLVQVGKQTDEFEIVGTLEANPSLGKISDRSPVGKALMGHRVGDVVAVEATMKTFYKIKRIRYSN